MAPFARPDRDRYPAPLLVPEKRATRGGARRARALPRGVAGVVASILIASMVAACGGSSANVATLPALHPNRTGPQSMFTPGAVLKSDPVPTMNALTRLGVQSVQVYVNWSSIAPDAAAFVKPAFDATDPNAYPARGWAGTTRSSEDWPGATSPGSTSRSPARLRTGPRAPATRLARPSRSGSPTPATTRTGSGGRTRYSGHFIPPGASRRCPGSTTGRVWNEPNLGINLAPETTHARSAVEVAPRLYRSLLNAAWTALHATGHGHDRS